MKMTEFFIKRPTLFWSFMVSIIIAGVMSFYAMPKLEDPAVAIKQAMVVVPYPGATAHEVELKVAQVMEEHLQTLPNVDKLQSNCQDGMLQMTVHFEVGVPNKEMEQRFDLLRRKVNDVQIYLPQDCGSPIVIDDMMDVYGIYYALTGDGYTDAELDKYAKLIKRELLSVDGVKRINLVGSRNEVVNINFSKEEISRNGLAPTQIMAALQSATSVIDAGSFQSGEDKMQVQVSNEVKNEDDLRNLMIKTTDGKIIHLSDIATVERSYVDPQTQGVFVNGQSAIAIMLTLENGVVVPDVGKEVDAQLNELLHSLPAGLSMEKIFFQPDKVNEAISSFMINLLSSVLIVVVVLVLTMGFRSGMIIGIGLLLTIGASLPILLVLDTTLQRISLGAFIIAMGMLVDNAIVVMDGILVDKKKGLSPKVYLYRTGQNNMWPLLGATVIAVSAFVSIYLAEGTASEYASALFIVLGVSLMVSWFLALVQVPIFAKQWYPAKGYKDRSERKGKNKGGESKTQAFVRKFIVWVVGHKTFTLIVSFLALAASIFGMTQVKNLFFPDFNYNQFIVEYHMPAQTSPNKVRDDMLEISDLLLNNPAINRVTATQGGAPGMYCLVRPMTHGGGSYGELLIECNDYDAVLEQIPDVQKQLRDAYPDAYIRIRKYNFSIVTSHTVEVEFAGPDPAVLRDLSHQAEDIMRQSDLVDAYSVENNWKPQEMTLLAAYNQQDALRAGINRSDIGRAVQAANDGATLGVIYDADDILMVKLNVRNADGSKIKDIKDIPVWSLANARLEESDVMGLITGGKSPDELKNKMYRSMPLSNVTDDVATQWIDNVVMRKNGQRVIEAECDPNYQIWKATPAAVVADIKDDIDAIELPDGYKMKWLGEIEMQEVAVESILGYLPLTIFIVIIVLLMLFDSWKQSLAILGCIPFVFIGITPTLLLTKTPFTFMAIIGLLGLIGMMVKNAIVLVNEINRLQEEEGMHPYHAIVDATVSRVSPVLLASLTTIVGMLPLLGDPMYGSMAGTIMGGLAIGTVITLILLPLFYATFYRVHKPEESKKLKK